MGGETLTASIVRVQVPEPIESRCFETVMDEGNLSILSRQTTSRAAGPPGANPGLPHDRLPHLLRI